MTDLAKLRAWIDEHEPMIVDAFRGVLQIPSTKAEPAGPDAPYGADIRRALDYTLDLCRRLGFRVKDVGGHAGHAEFGDGDEMIAAFGHLDVVPAGDGWRHDPFGAAVEPGGPEGPGGGAGKGVIYARGATDDKGGIYAALFGAKALMESGLPVGRRVRVIFGCDEESGFGCVRHYWEVAGEERPVLGFTPDAAFPLFYAEKGVLGLVLERDVPPEPGGLRIVSARGGTRPNIVPDRAEARLEGAPEDLYKAVVALHAWWDRNVEALPDERGITVRARGRAAHGAAPQAGDNAIARLVRALLPIASADAEWLFFVLAATAPDGAGLGIAGRDEVTGPLTCNAAVLDLTDGRAEVQYNIRYPATWQAADVVDRARQAAERRGWRVVRHRDSRPLHVPVDAEPCRTLLRVYREETGDTQSRPATMGGATYARATPNAVCFGPVFPGSGDGVAHQADEHIAIASLLRAAKVYGHALYALAHADAS